MINHDTLAEFSTFLWPALAGHLWQATIVAGLCLLSLPAFLSAGAKARYTLWALAFVRFVIPQDLVFFVAGHLGIRVGSGSSLGTPLQKVTETVVQVTQPSILVNHQPAASSAPAHSEVYCILTVIWLAGCIILLSRWCYRHYGFAKSLRTAKNEDGNELMHILESLVGRLGICMRARLRVVWQGSDPGVYGVWRPVFVFPKEMPRQLNPAEIEAVLAHELVHVARWDNLWSNLQMLVCCVFWFHPVIWILDRCLIAERERSCDERVIEALRNSKAYASGLIKMTSIGLGLRTAGVSPMAGANLKRRIENMNKTNRKAGLPVRILLSSIAALIVLLYLAAAPLQKSEAQNTPSNLTIENSEKSPLQIVSATVADVSAPAVPTKDVMAHLVKPKIVVKNNSDRAVSVYVLEFRKANSAPFYLARTETTIEPKGTDTIQANEQNTFLYLAEGTKSEGAGGNWTVRVDVVRFKDGNVMTLHGSPIPPPPVASLPGGVVGGIPRGVAYLVPPPPPPRPSSPPSPPLSQRLIAVSGDVMESKLIRRVDPVYPELAKRARVQTRVFMDVTIDEEGNVTDAKVTKGHPLLNDSAVMAVKQWKYSPTLLNGKPVPVTGNVWVDFKLK
jgi:TonB family protein